ncbi:MAG: hypothetical protein D6744_00050 [Planctomycetota bacterium]|nr:MAG: hypothetical protein D6744_00050 [Planctomycetota bacterium]
MRATVLIIAIFTAIPCVGEVILDVDQRSLDAEYSYDGVGGSGSDYDELHATDFSPLDFAIDLVSPIGAPFVESRAAQTSEYLIGSMQAGGSAGVHAVVGAGNMADLMASSVFAATFQITAPSHFTIDIDLDATLDIGADALPNGWAAVTLTGPSGVLVDESLTDAGGAIFGPLSVTRAGVLAPGSYTVVAEAVQSLDVPDALFLGQGSSSYEISFDITPIPEPGTLLAVVLALAAARPRRTIRV